MSTDLWKEGSFVSVVLAAVLHQPYKGLRAVVAHLGHIRKQVAFTHHEQDLKHTIQFKLNK